MIITGMIQFSRDADASAHVGTRKLARPIEINNYAQRHPEVNQPRTNTNGMLSQSSRLQPAKAYYSLGKVLGGVWGRAGEGQPEAGKRFLRQVYVQRVPPDFLSRQTRLRNIPSQSKTSNVSRMTLSQSTRIERGTAGGQKSSKSFRHTDQPEFFLRVFISESDRVVNGNRRNIDADSG